jgi:uncharacterized protein
MKTEERMHSKIIERALEFTKNIFENDFSGHDYFHTLRVFKMATRIATEEGAELETVQLVALLHDVDDVKLSPKTHKNKDNARKFLRENNVDENRIDEICRMIGEISYAGKDSVVPSTIEGKCAQDADRLDAIGAIGIARAFAYGGNHKREMHNPEIKPNLDMNEEEYRKSNSTTINHFYEKLFKLTEMINTPTAKKIAEARESYMKAYIDEFMAEWDGQR